MSAQGTVLDTDAYIDPLIHPDAAEDRFYSTTELMDIILRIDEPVIAFATAAKIAAFPWWMRLALAATAGLAAAAVSVLNSFLSFVAMIVGVALTTAVAWSVSRRVTTGMTYEPRAFKIVWLGAFVSIAPMALIIVLRSVVDPPAITLVAFLLMTVLGYLWLTVDEMYQLRRLNAGPPMIEGSATCALPSVSN
ncbi:MAG: hypothetical protein Q4G30_07535 [Actinomycetaceae bacterium]|nr:hypothetical protein [Actinomycetaceae bacterium]